MKIDAAGLSFDRSAVDYDTIRPSYPELMYEDIVSQTQLTENDKILDIGSGTGQAVIPLLERGFQVTCLEPGENLYTLLKKNTNKFENTHLVNSTFENWSPDGKYNLITAGTSFHWLDLNTSFIKTKHLLDISGHLSLFWNIHPRPFRGFFEAVQEIYKNNFPVTNKKKSWKDLSSKKDIVIQQIRNSNLLDPEYEKSYNWSTTFTSDEYLRLLNTFSDNIMLPAWKREKLFAEIKELIDSEYCGKIERPYCTYLYIMKQHN
jgi:trans-aconitate methyltransferase